MKKSLLVAAAAMIGFSAMALTPEELKRSEIFGYCPDGDYTSVAYSGGMPANTMIGAAIYLPEEILEDYDDWYITQFHMMSGNTIEGVKENLLTEAILFIREELEDRSLVRQDIKLSPVFKEWNVIDLDQPFKIDPTVGIYVGVMGVQPAERAAPFVSDGIKVGTMEDPGNGFWNYSYNMGWTNRSWNAGSLMMRLTMTYKTGTKVASVNGSKNYFAYASNGAIELKGDFEKAEIFNLNGVKVASTNEAGFINVAAGTYAVSFDGMPAQKIIVK